MNKILGIITLAIWFAVAFAIFIAFNKLGYSMEESENAQICHLPEEIIYKYILIGQRNAYGALINRFWLDTVYYGIDPQGKIDREDYPRFREAYIKALANNYNLSEAVSEPEGRYLKRMTRNLKENCLDNKRRSNFSERFKDFLQMIGLATLLGIAGLVSYKITPARP